MKILAIHAHPDDCEILAGGTLALLAQAGHQITLCTMTPGDCGSAEMPADEIAAIRRLEAATAAMMIGAEYLCAEFRDLAIFNDDASRRRVTHLLRQVRPEIVLTANTPDYHCDHEATHLLVRDACFGVSAPNYAPGEHPALEAIPHLYMMDSTAGIDRDGNILDPDFYVEVSESIEIKAMLVGCHSSQRNWLRRQHGMDDYVDMAIRWTKARGAQTGLAHAEGFRQYRGHPYPQSPLLQGILNNITTVVNK